MEEFALCGCFCLQGPPQKKEVALLLVSLQNPHKKGYAKNKSDPCLWWFFPEEKSTWNHAGSNLQTWQRHAVVSGSLGCPDSIPFHWGTLNCFSACVRTHGHASPSSKRVQCEVCLGVPQCFFVFYNCLIMDALGQSLKKPSKPEANNRRSPRAPFGLGWTRIFTEGKGELPPPVN